MKAENKTLVILTPGFALSEADTVCLPMQQSFIRTLQALFPELKIIILSFQYPYYKKTYNWFDITVTSFNGQNKAGIKRLWLRREINRTLKDIQNNNHISGILSFWYGECAYIGKKFSDRHNVKHLCWIMGQDAKTENSYPKRLRANAGELVALSDFLQDEFETNHHIRPKYVIPYGIDVKQFNAGVPEKNIDVLTAGSLIPLKQYEIFIEIIAGLKKGMPGISAMIIGDGPEKEKLEMLIRKYGLEENCRLAGELDHNSVLETMQQARLFLHPSSYEGFSGVCLEALYAGTHVISFCRAMKEEIEHWHIVQNKEEMKQKALLILRGDNIEYKQVLIFSMEDSVRELMGLFNE